MKWLILLTLMMSACTVDTEGLPAIADYRDWNSIETRGELPAHGDSVRVIFANDIARTYTGAGLYPVGTVLVKEVRDYGPGDAPGDLRYLAVMRKLGDEAPMPDGGDIEGGWLFTTLDELGQEERAGITCWNSCHAQGPVDGAWFDYGY